MIDKHQHYSFSFENILKLNTEEMVTIKTFKAHALSFAEAVELPHFENISFRVNKKIFVALSEKDKRVCVKFSDIDQFAFCAFNKSIIYPVPNKWGRQGWTFIELNKVKKEILTDALTTSYCVVASKRLSTFYRDKV